MEGNQQRFGMSAALATPFSADQTIDQDRLSAHAGWCLDNGCDSVTLFGTTGEGPSLSAAERATVLARLQADGVPGDKLVFAVFANSVGDAVEQIRVAYGFGARAVLVAPPSYFKGVTEEGVAGWYQAVIRQLGDAARDILLYNIPSLTGVALSVDLVGRLRQSHGPSIVGVKDSSCDWTVTDPLVRAHNDIHILVGDERDLAAAVRLGAAGCISGMANVFPHAVAGLVRGQDDPFLSGVVDAINRYPILPAIKTLIAENTRIPAWATVRPPLVPLSAGEGRQFVEAVEALKQSPAA
ncbi:MAG: dihydrodipicolinate synthase family protein [Hyphomicrobiales bacterium]|nr:dihydrodipicolinate synthase family protein [Hyphomicrobiales bacterium]